MSVYAVIVIHVTFISPSFVMLAKCVMAYKGNQHWNYDMVKQWPPGIPRYLLNQRCSYSWGELTVLYCDYLLHICQSCLPRPGDAITFQKPFGGNHSLSFREQNSTFKKHNVRLKLWFGFEKNQRSNTVWVYSYQPRDQPCPRVSSSGPSRGEWPVRSFRCGPASGVVRSCFCWHSEHRARNVRRLNVWGLGPLLRLWWKAGGCRRHAVRLNSRQPPDKYFSSPLAPLHGQEIEILCCIGRLMAIYQNGGGRGGGGQRGTAWEPRPALWDQRWAAGLGVQKVKRGEPALGERGYSSSWGVPISNQSCYTYLSLL